MQIDWKNYRIYLWIYSTKSIKPQTTTKNNLSCLRKKETEDEIKQVARRYSG